MVKLVRTKKQVFESLNYLLECYDAYKKLNYDKQKAIKYTLEKYDDFYDWLRGVVE